MKYTKKTLSNLVQALYHNGGSVAHACKSVRIHRRTFYQWLEKDTEIKHQGVKQTLRDWMNDIREEAVDNVESAFYKNCLEGNAGAQIFFLKTRGRDRGYQEITKNEHAIVDEFEGKTEEELLAEIEQLKKRGLGSSNVKG